MSLCPLSLRKAILFLGQIAACNSICLDTETSSCSHLLSSPTFSTLPKEWTTISTSPSVHPFLRLFNGLEAKLTPLPSSACHIIARLVFPFLLVTESLVEQVERSDFSARNISHHVLLGETTMIMYGVRMVSCQARRFHRHFGSRFQTNFEGPDSDS